MSLTRFLMLRLCIVCLPPTLWELSAIKLLRDKKLFFYFRVTISLNNAKTLGGVAERLQRGRYTVLDSIIHCYRSWRGLFFLQMLRVSVSSNNIWEAIVERWTVLAQNKDRNWTGRDQYASSRECSVDRTAKERFPVVCGSRALSAELSEVEVTLNVYILQERKV